MASIIPKRSFLVYNNFTPVPNNLTHLVMNLDDLVMNLPEVYSTKVLPVDKGKSIFTHSSKEREAK